MRCGSFLLSSLLFFSTPSSTYGQAERQAALTSPEERAALHRSSDWGIIAPHLPDPDTASAAQLETAADVLRARRFPEDALDYYGYAMARGGNVSELLNKMGVVRLELRQTELARQMFLRTVRVQKKNAVAWNNLGVTEYSVQNYRAAIGDYQRAAKLDKRSAVFHSNLGMAYFGAKDMESARTQFALAIRLDPSIMQGERDGSGSTAHVLGTTNYGELSFQMAELYARERKPLMVKLWLSKAAEAGFDVRGEMKSVATLLPYVHDPEVLQMLSNAAQLRDKHLAKVNGIPSLGNAQPLVN
jgi:tetratricopeptide (TPR) repeat protein